MNELKITGAQLESLEHYVDRQREIGTEEPEEEEEDHDEEEFELPVL